MGQDYATRGSSTPTASTANSRSGAEQLWEQDALGNAFMAATLLSSGGEREPGPATPTDFTTRARAVFPVIDTDHDGFVSGSEIDDSITHRAIRGENAAAVAVLKRLQAELEELSDDEWGDENDGVTLADLTAYERTGSVPRSLRERTEAWYAAYRGRITGASHALMPNGTPSVDAIQQGGLGDCFFLAAIGSLVQRDPGAVARMVTDNGDGTYTVTFPGQSPVTVSAPTDAELALYARSGADGMWLTLLEKAYGRIQDDDASVPNEGADALIGGSLGSGVAFVTGHGTNTDMLSATDSPITAARLTAAFDEGRIVTAGIRKGIMADDTGGLPMGHAYSVVAWNPGSQRLTLRNPWGHQELTDTSGNARDGRDDGTFELTLDEFYEHFTLICYEEGS